MTKSNYYMAGYHLGMTDAENRFSFRGYSVSERLFPNKESYQNDFVNGYEAGVHANDDIIKHGTKIRITGCILGEDNGLTGTIIGDSQRDSKQFSVQLDPTGEPDHNLCVTESFEELS